MNSAPLPPPRPLRHLWVLGLLVMSLSWLQACSGKNDNNASCDPGSESCACDAGSCSGALICKADVCVASCTLGEEGCACLESATCNTAGTGEQLACVDSVCAMPACTPGEVGCACDAGACGEGLECSSASGVERCEVTGCEVGTPGCGCQLDRTCTAGAACVQSKCEAVTCKPGAPDCACASNYGCEAGTRCDVNGSQLCNQMAECTPGNTGCACDAGGGCVGDLDCTNGMCEGAGCSPGLEGCACLAGECGETASGDLLECNAGMCQRSACPSGDTGCACQGGNTCNEEGASCTGGICKNDECIPGTKNCDCLGGGCNIGLVCENNSVCVDNKGRSGGPCKTDGTCDRNNRCDNSILPAVCVRCELGTLGCQCQDDASCSPGLSCSGQNICAGDATVHSRRLPTDPSCFTPCAQDLVQEDGTRIRCSSEGLLPGCVDDMVCMEGNCVPPGEERKVCYKDGNCSDFQLCIQGHCYSECNAESDCASGQGCHRKVCRDTCSLSQDSCEDGMVCDSEDGQNGFCVAAASSESTPQEVPPEGEMGLTRERIDLTSSMREQQVELVNNSDNFITFTLEKRTHKLVDKDGMEETVRLVDQEGGACTGASCPLWWLELGETGQISQDLKTEYRAVPNCLTRTAFESAQLDFDQDPANFIAPSPSERCPVVNIRIPSNSVNAVRWRGTIRVSSQLGLQTLKLSYTERPEGRWYGKMVYFANFDDSGVDNSTISGIERKGWLGRDRDAVQGRSGFSSDIPVSNALIQRWGAFRNGNVSGGWTEMLAMLKATEVEQWRWPTTRDACPVANGACYLYADAASTGAGTRVYVTSTADSPIPTGVTVFPMAINLFTPDAQAAEKLVGRVVSDIALHYAGYPHVDMEFEADPANPANCDPEVLSNCVNFFKTANQGTAETDGFNLDLIVGGRYSPTGSGLCAQGYEKRAQPWLIPGFLGDAFQDPSNGVFYQEWCEDFRLPDYKSDLSQISDAQRIENSSLARANPVPNGNVLPRRVELLDGAMIDQSQMFVLFRERYPSFIGGEDLVAYGYLLLERKPVDIDDELDSDGDGVPDPYDGNIAPPDLPDVDVDGLTCSEEILSKIDMQNVNFTNETQRNQVISRLINGREISVGTNALVPNPSCFGGEIVHYVCNDTGKFDGGTGNTACWGKGARGPNDDSCTPLSKVGNGVCDDGGPGSATAACAIGTDRSDCGWRYTDTREACPRTSAVTYFTAPSSADNQIRNHACQSTGTCMSVLNGWIQSGSVITQVDPVWTCEGDSLSCDDNPLDRRDGKVFYKQSSDEVYFGQLRAEIESAFRYKTQFVGRDGTSLGFTPDICIPFSSSTPYCYDAQKIEELRDRIDCLLSLHRDHYASTNLDNADLFTYLDENFSARVVSNQATGQSKRYDGFERLYAELLIMLGDDAYTSAFESRFDLAANNVAGFQGENFEAGGISLSGISGYEMYRLHQAVQYYSMVLDRFYDMSGSIAAVLASEVPPSAARNYLSNETVTLYFDRLVRASTQRARALSEIARRYQKFNRPELARRVALRAYTSTYLESIALANVVQRLSEITGGAGSAELVLELERSQRRYRMALLDLVNVYQSITNEVNIFGFSPDYIPFPALSATGNLDVNAFDKVLQLALSKLDVARQRESAALSQTRQFDTDEASFQAELTRLNRNYENQLGEICGIFTSQIDGRVYPAVETYAYHDERLSAIGSPCGFAGNGGIHSVLGQLDLAKLELEGSIIQMQNVHERIQIEKERVAAQCGLQASQLEYQIKKDKESFKLNEMMISSQETIQWAQKATAIAGEVAQAVKCENQIECITGGISAGIVVAASGIEIGITIDQLNKQRKLREQQQELKEVVGEWQIDNVCRAAEIDLNASTQALLLELRSQEITMLANTQRSYLLLSEVSKLRQQARRIELEQQESLELSINVESAKNDPNVRIYRNDSVINAEVAFDDALREAYRLTLVYQYYTSQSYAPLEQLFLIRMVAAGDYNLENYIFELRNAFTSFEEDFGNPDVRVEVISLRDYIMRIPRTAADGSPIPIDARASMMREGLLDPKMLNSDGYITIPFSTNIQRLSPLTRNHKILHIEANIEGNANGDYLGRLYLRQAGTSTINTVEDEFLFYRFPERTAVLNPFFNSTREFSSAPEVYRSYRLRDRPVINNNWELIINQRDEEVNQDIDLNALTDIKLYIYYTDFTVY